MKFHSYLRWLFLASLFFNTLVSVASSPYAPDGCGYNVALYADKLLTPGTTEPGHQVQALGHYYLEHTPAHDFIGVHRITDTFVGNCLKNITNFNEVDFASWADHADGSLSIDGTGNGPGSYTLTPEDNNNIVLKYEPDPLATTDPRFFIYITPDQPIEQFHVTLLDVNPSQIVWIVNGSIEFSGPAEIPGLLICNGTATFSGLTTYTPALWIRDKAIFSTVSGSGPLCTTSCLKSLNQQSYDSGKTLLQTLFGRDNSVFLHADYASSYNPLTLNYRSSMHSGGSNLYPLDSLLVGSGTSVTNMDMKVDSLIMVLDANMLRSYSISSGAGGRLNPGIYNIDGGSDLRDFHLTGDDRSIYIFLVGGTFNPDQMDYGLVKPENVFFYGKILTVSSSTSARGVFVAGGISIYAPDIEAALYAGNWISIASTRARAYGPRGKVLNIHLAPSNSLAKLNDSTLSLCTSSGAVPVNIITSFATSLRVQSLQDTTVTSDQTYTLSDSASEITTVYISEAATSLRLVGMSVDDTLQKPDITIQRRPSGVLTSLFPMIGALDSVSGNYRVADTSDFLLTAFADTTGLDSLVWNFSTGEKRVTASSTLNHPPLLWMQTIMARVQAYRDGCPSVMRSIGYSGGAPLPTDAPQVGLRLTHDYVRVWRDDNNSYSICKPYLYDTSSRRLDYRNLYMNKLPEQLVSAKYGGYEFMPYYKMTPKASIVSPGFFRMTYPIIVKKRQHPSEDSTVYIEEFAYFDFKGADPNYTINTSLFIHDACEGGAPYASASCGHDTIKQKNYASIHSSLYWKRWQTDCSNQANFFHRYSVPAASSPFYHMLEYSNDSTGNWSNHTSYSKLEWSKFQSEDINTTSSNAYSKLRFKFRASYRGASMKLSKNASVQLFRWNLGNEDVVGLANGIASGTSPHNRYHLIRFINPNKPTEYLVVALIKPKGDRGFFGAVADLATERGVVGDTTSEEGKVHDRALKGTYSIVYSWSGLSGRDVPPVSCDFQTSGGLSYIQRDLEIRVFSCPMSPQAYEEKVQSALSDILDEIKDEYPFVNDFPLRGPIASVFVSQTDDSATYHLSSNHQKYNPNRYLRRGNGGSIIENLYTNYGTRDINPAGWDSLRIGLLSRVVESCKSDTSLRGSGLIIWDLEGNPTEHTNSQTGSGISYVGDLEAVLKPDSAYAAELLRPIPGRSYMRLIDLAFDTIRRSYGLVPGITIRPQKLIYDPKKEPKSGCQRQVPFVVNSDMTEAQVQARYDEIATLLAQKMFYAYSMPYTYKDSAGTLKQTIWGVRIFYVDSPYTWDLRTTVSGAGTMSQYRWRTPLDPKVYYLAREKFKAYCLTAGIDYHPIAILPETTVDGGTSQDLGLLASTFPYVPYFREAADHSKFTSSTNATIVKKIAKSLYPKAAIYVHFGDIGVNQALLTQLGQDIDAYFRYELNTCNHISGYRGWITGDGEFPKLRDHLYKGTKPKIPLGGCFMSSPPEVTTSNGFLDYKCKPTIVLDNGGYRDYQDPSNSKLKILASSSRFPILDLISGVLDTRDTVGSVYRDSVVIRKPSERLEYATGSAFQDHIEPFVSDTISVLLSATGGHAAAGFAYQLGCKNPNEPVITHFDKSVAIEGCVLRVYGKNLNNCTFSLTLIAPRFVSPIRNDPAGNWADISIPRFDVSFQDTISSISMFTGAYVYVKSLATGNYFRSPSQIKIRRGSIVIDKQAAKPCEPVRLKVSTPELVLFNQQTGLRPYYRWYRVSGAISSIDGDVVRCNGCFPSDGRPNQYLFIEGAGEFRIRRHLSDSRLQLYSGDSLPSTSYAGRTVSVGGNENLEGDSASITNPGNYWCYDVNLGSPGVFPVSSDTSTNHLKCVLQRSIQSVSSSDLVECGLLFAGTNDHSIRVKSASTAKLNLNDSAFTFEMLLSYNGGALRRDTATWINISQDVRTDATIVDINNAFDIFPDKYGHIATRLFSGDSAHNKWQQLVSQDILVPKNVYHISVVRTPDHKLKLYVVPVSGLRDFSHTLSQSASRVDSFRYNRPPSRVPESSFKVASTGFPIASTSSLFWPTLPFGLTLSGQDSAMQVRGIRLWRGARSEALIRADGLRMLSGEDTDSGQFRQVFDYRFLAKSTTGANTLQTVPLDPDLVLAFGGANQPVLKYSSCAMAHPDSALAGPDEYPKSTHVINLVSAQRNPEAALSWTPSSSFDPASAPSGDNFVLYKFDSTNSHKGAQLRCNKTIPLFRRIRVPYSLYTPGDSGLKPYPWKLYSYVVGSKPLDADRIKYEWSARNGDDGWQVVAPMGNLDTLRYAWVKKSVEKDSIKVKIRTWSGSDSTDFIRKILITPRYMVEFKPVQSTDTSRAGFDSTRVAVLAPEFLYPNGQIHNHLPKVVFKTCGGGAFRYRMHVWWRHPYWGVTIRDLPSNLVGTVGGVPMSTALYSNSLDPDTSSHPRAYAYSKIYSTPNENDTLVLQVGFRFNYADVFNYGAYTLPISVVVRQGSIDTSLAPLTIRAACVKGSPKLVADSLSTSYSLFAMPGGRSSLDTTWTSGRYTAYGVVNGKCRAGSFGVMNGDTGAYVLDHDTILNGTTIVIKDLLVREDNVHVRLSQNATLYMLAAPPMDRNARKKYDPRQASSQAAPFVFDSLKMQDIRFEGRGGIQMRAGSSIQGVCNMWGGLQLYSQAYLTVHPYQPVDTNMVMPVIADAYRGVRILDSGAVHEGSRSIPYDSLLVYPKLLLKQFRFLNNRVAIDDRDPHRHLGLIENCIFSCNPAQMKAPYHTGSFNIPFLGFKAINLKGADGDRVFRNLTIKGYQFGIVGQDSTGRVFVRSSTFDSCATAAVYSRRSEVHFESSYVHFPKLLQTAQARNEKQSGEPYQTPVVTDLFDEDRPYGILMERGNPHPLQVSDSRFEGVRTDTNFSQLKGTGIWAPKGQLTLLDTRLRRLKLGVGLAYKPSAGYHSIHGAQFWANRTSIKDTINSQTIDLDLTCSSFEPGDTLPDYSGSARIFQRHLSGAAVGIRLGIGAIGNIGQMIDPTPPNPIYTSGANIFPLDSTIDRTVNPFPSTHDVHESGSPWYSPTGWISIVYSGAAYPKYRRFRNEFLGSGLSAITGDTSLRANRDANSTDVPNCNQADDEFSFPARIKSPQATTSISSLIKDDLDLNLSPNPTSDLALISYRLAGHDRSAGILELIAIAEEIPKWSRKVFEKQGVVEISLSTMPSGVYLLRLRQAGNEPKQIRVVKLK